MATPAELAQDERVAQVLMAIAVAPLARIHAAPVVLMSADAPPVGILGLHVGPSHFTLSVQDARIVVIALRQDLRRLEIDALAAGLEAAANLVELMQLRAEIRDLRTRLAVSAAAPATTETSPGATS